jgi:Holliday junction resolvasome RuvABC endonuclease subunit
MILGLDISSSCVGYSLWNSGSLARYGFVDLSNIDNLFQKIDTFLQIFEFDIDQIEAVYVEDIQQSFARGFSSVNTTILLAKMNAALSYAVHKKTNKEINYLNVNHLRKVIGLTVKRNGTKAKEQTFDFVYGKFNLFLKWTKNETIDKRSLDITDAIAVGYAATIITRSTSECLSGSR